MTSNFDLLTRTTAKLARGAPTLRQMVLLSNVLSSQTRAVEQDLASQSSRRALEEQWLDGVLEDMIMQEEIDDEPEEEEETEPERAEGGPREDGGGRVADRIGGDYVAVNFRHHPQFPWTRENTPADEEGGGKADSPKEQTDSEVSSSPEDSWRASFPASPYFFLSGSGSTGSSSTSSLFAPPHLSSSLDSVPRSTPLPESPPPEPETASSPPPGQFAPPNGYSFLCRGVESAGPTSLWDACASDESLHTAPDADPVPDVEVQASSPPEMDERFIRQMLGGTCTPNELEERERAMRSSKSPRRVAPSAVEVIYARLPFRGVEVYQDDAADLKLDDEEEARRGRQPRPRALDFSSLTRYLVDQSGYSYPPLPPSPLFPPPPPSQSGDGYFNQPVLNTIAYHPFIPPGRRSPSGSLSPARSPARSSSPVSPPVIPEAPPPPPVFQATSLLQRLRPSGVPPPPLAPPPPPPLHLPEPIITTPRRPPPPPLAPEPPPIPVWALRGARRDGLVHARVSCETGGSGGGVAQEADGKRWEKTEVRSFYDFTDVGEARRWCLGPTR